MARHNGYAVAITWPRHWGKQAGSWYDPVMRWLGANRNYHYRVGHAALLLVDQSGACLYFDCGRFHAPYQEGRIRGANTDDELIINTKASFRNETIVNLAKILKEIQLNPANIGEGPILAVQCPVNYEGCIGAVRCVQDRGSFPFGPFVISGTNCCRFVRNAILAGRPSSDIRRKLRWLFPVWPKPITIIRLIGNAVAIPSRKELSFHAGRSPNGVNILHELIYNKDNINSNLPSPHRPVGIPVDSQWLSGEVLGSWYHLQRCQSGYQITRFAADGHVECSGLFRPGAESAPDLSRPFEFSHISHCESVTIRQNGREYVLRRVDNPGLARSIGKSS